MSIRQNQIIASVIIPTHNESSNISACLTSLLIQTFEDKEIIIIDDGSTDDTVEIAKSFPTNIFQQKHQGPGIARNLGASKAKGKILIFIDADMTFEKNFVRRLLKPITEGKAIGTDSQDEYLTNYNNFWARCWNIGRFSAAGVLSNSRRDIVPDKSNHGGIFRAILKREFDRVGGFETGGDYTDDESLARRLKIKSTLVRGAKFYHRNPDTVSEVWQRATWIGSSKNFTGSTSTKSLSLAKFSLPASILKGLLIGIRYKETGFLVFKIIYDAAIFFAVLRSI